MRYIFCALLLLGLVGCAGEPITYGEVVRSSYTLAEFGRGAGRRDLWTQFRGNPFDLEEDAFHERMIEILARHPPKPQPTNYTTQPGESADTNFRVVFLFDPPVKLLPGQLCRLPIRVPSGDAKARPLRVAAAFCRNQGVLTSIRGEIAVADSINDPGFDGLIGQMVDGLFPNVDANDDNGFPFFLRPL